jgi:intracellular septation protein
MLIISSLVVYCALFIKQRKLEKSQWLTLVACLVFGSLTLAFHSETFLKWKAPVVNWLFALAFIGSHFIGDRLLIKRIMGHALTLPEPVWTRLNIAWIVFFLFCGAANLFVAFTYQSYWVDFKVFGSLGMTLLFLIGQGIYLSRHLHHAKNRGLTCFTQSLPQTSPTPWKPAWLHALRTWNACRHSRAKAASYWPVRTRRSTAMIRAQRVLPAA